jgi:hypothetical protein
VDWLQDNSLGLVAACIAACSALIAFMARRVAKESRDEARKANDRADTPVITLTTTGRWPRGMGFPVDLTSNKDLDSLEISLAALRVDDRVRATWLGLWTGLGDCLPARVLANSPVVRLADVPAGTICALSVEVRDLPISNAKVEITLRAACRMRDREWVVVVGTGEVEATWAPR